MLVTTLQILLRERALTIARLYDMASKSFVDKSEPARARVALISALNFVCTDGFFASSHNAHVNALAVVSSNQIKW